MKLIRQLYTTVAVPKITYAVDVWYMPIYSKASQKRNSGLVGYTHKMATVQRMASTPITGALCTMATDMMDLHENLLPVKLLLHKICHRVV